MSTLREGGREGGGREKGGREDRGREGKGGREEKRKRMMMGSRQFLNKSI